MLIIGKDGMKDGSVFLHPSPAEFPKWTCPASVFGAVRYQFCGYQENNLELAWLCIIMSLPIK